MSDVLPGVQNLGLRSSITLYPTILLMGEKPTYLDAPRQYAESATGMVAEAMPI